ncbi:hypothetical protein MMC30_008624 [Trapelia coarctata]|nr:hypothetical protein [Trapelia coarctata]
MNIAKLVRRNAPPTNDGLPSTQELLQDDSTSFLRELTSPKQAEVDLVAVHGLNFANAKAHAVKSWTAGEEGEERLWLKDFLPHRLPNVRVLLFSYNSNVAFHTSKVGVGDIAEDLLHKLWTKRQSAPDRPLLFVAHSLGGLVVKRAIVKARSIGRYSLIHHSAKSFAFFATPHRGGFGAEVGQAAAGFVRRLGMNPRTGIMEALRKDSHIAPEINNDFVDGQENYHICSFYECRPMPPLSALVVEKSSAILGLGTAETRIPCVNADHSSICKFAIEDESYRFVIDEIEDLVHWTLGVAGLSMLEFRPSNAPSTSSEGSYPSYQLGTHEQKLSIASTSSEGGHSSSHLTGPRWGQNHLNPFLNEDMGSLSISPAMRYRSQPKSIRQVRTGPFFLVPYPQNFDFVGQQSIIHQLRQFSDASKGVRNKMAIWGLGGTGKSQIALAHAYWYRLNYPGNSVFWIHASSPDQLRDSLEMIAAHCRLSQPEDPSATVLDRVRRWLLDENNGHWLMVVDSADHLDTFTKPLEGIQPDPLDSANNPLLSIGLGSYLPAPAHGRILYTTNNKLLGETLAAQGNVLEVNPMDKNDACALVRRLLVERELSYADEKVDREAWSDHDLEVLTQQLDFLPLALTQAVAFMRQNVLSVKEYLQLISEDESKLTSLLEHDFRDRANINRLSKAVSSTWKIGFDHIEAQCRPAADLLSLMAVLEVQGIPRYLVEHFQTSNNQVVSRSIETLLAYSFVTTGSGNEMIYMHRLVQLAMRQRLVTYNTEAEWVRQAMRLLSEKFPEGGYDSWRDCAMLFPHALKVLTTQVYGSAEAIPLGILQSKVSWYCLNRGDVEKAEVYSQRALDNIEFAAGAKQADILAIKANCIIILQKLARYEEAEDMAQEVWRARRTTLGEKHEDTIKSFTTLSLIYQEQGKYLEAEKTIRKVLRSLKRGFEPDDELVIEAKRRLATILHYLGKYMEAEKYALEAIQGYERNTESDYSTLLKAKWRLAWILHSQGRYSEAELVNSQTWKAQIDILGADHPDTIKSRYGLANDLQAQLKFSSAESHMREVYSKAVQIVGATHIYTLISASSLASCLVASNLYSGRPSAELYVEAEDLYRLSLDGRQKLLREDHPETLAARTDLTNIQRLRRVVPPSEIEALERETLSKLKKALGREHPLALKSRDSLARILWVQKDIKFKRSEALKQAKKVLEIREKRQGWEQDETRKVAELVVRMLPDGKERRNLLEKIA